MITLDLKDFNRKKIIIGEGFDSRVDMYETNLARNGGKGAKGDQNIMVRVVPSKSGVHSPLTETLRSNNNSLIRLYASLRVPELQSDEKCKNLEKPAPRDSSIHFKCVTTHL